MDPALAFEIEHVSRQKALEREALRGVSDIRGFYSGSTALVTGGTGFIGKQLIEKLLRSCDVKRIYILMRSKKDYSTQDRLQKQFKDPVYDNLRVVDPDFECKVSSVEGDIAELGLGLNDDDERKIIEEVNVIFHAAATTRFQEPLKKATLINVRGTREVLKLAQRCQKLRSFLHVSTAFSFATRSRIDGDIEEQFYSSPVPPHVIIQLAETVDEERLNDITNELIKDWPNTYCFTKAIAEDLVRTLGKDLPVTVVRPPIVAGAYNEPAPGWVDKSSVIGPTGVILGLGIGVNHVLLAADTKLAIMPLDYVNNALISAAWETAQKQRNNEEITVYNINNAQNTIKWGQLSEFMNSSQAFQYCTPKAVWYCFTYETTNKFVFWFLTWLFHYIPAYVADFVFNITGMKRPEGIKSFVQIYEKIYKSSILYSYFLLNQWNFRSENMAALFDKMSKTDKVLFNFDVKSIDWIHTLLIWGIGLRKYILKDGLKDSEYAIRKQRWLMLAHVTFYTVVFGVIAYFFYLCYKMVMFLF